MDNKTIMLEKKIVYRGAKEICAAVGINWKSIRYYVNEMGLPAFKLEDKGAWMARPEDLEKWIAQQKDIFLNNKSRV